MYAIGLMPGGVLEERLRAWVRVHVGRRGMKARLADHLQRDPEWVSMYLRGRRDADFDTTVRIVDFFKVSLEHLIGDALPTLTQDDREIRELWATVDEKYRPLMRRHLKGLPQLAPHADAAQLVRRNPAEPQATARRNSGKRRGA